MNDLLRSDILQGDVDVATNVSEIIDIRRRNGNDGSVILDGGKYDSFTHVNKESILDRSCTDLRVCFTIFIFKISKAIDDASNKSARNVMISAHWFI